MNLKETVESIKNPKNTKSCKTHIYIEPFFSNVRQSLCDCFSYECSNISNEGILKFDSSTITCEKCINILEQLKRKAIIEELGTDIK